MTNLGAYLKKIRNLRHLSLKDVQDQCGITDSKLSRLERGEGRDITPCDLKKLARLYEIGVIPLYLMAGYLDENDLLEYQFIFENAQFLTEEEKRSIQTQINLFTKERRLSNHDL